MTDTSDARTFALKDGGSATVGDAQLLVSGDPGVKIDYDDVVEITVEEIDWFGVVLGLAVVGFGLVSITRDALLGAAFAALGVGSLYLTARRRNRVVVRVTGRPKPVTLYPEDATAFYRTLGDAAGE